MTTEMQETAWRVRTMTTPLTRLFMLCQISTRSSSMVLSSWFLVRSEALRPEDEPAHVGVRDGGTAGQLRRREALLERAGQDHLLGDLGVAGGDRRVRDAAFRVDDEAHLHAHRGGAELLADLEGELGRRAARTEDGLLYRQALLLRRVLFRRRRLVDHRRLHGLLAAPVGEPLDGPGLAGLGELALGLRGLLVGNALGRPRVLSRGGRARRRSRAGARRTPRGPLSLSAAPRSPSRRPPRAPPRGRRR